ncbi:hypothetical protein DUI87_24900 [Hirundo rustica rustica]|uniref:Uncharacterized protein n=1 Tax=Hirundo rustica rustica TaxID=333673 RepID=A0A3M0JCK2_HIRRU|nr:hypothetical protein DUI87_24900 [Hirundo rustica rustica]
MSTSFRPKNTNNGGLKKENKKDDTLKPKAVIGQLNPNMQMAKTYKSVLPDASEEYHKPKTAGPGHYCPHNNHPFETTDLSHLAYLQDVTSAPPSSLIPERSTVDVATRSLPL